MTNVTHNCGDRTPYVYMLGWSARDRWYIGRRTARGCHPDGILTRYMTSSDYVKADIAKHGMPDVVLTHVCDTPDDAVVLEKTLLGMANAVKDKRYLNRANWNGDHVEVKPTLKYVGENLEWVFAMCGFSGLDADEALGYKTGTTGWQLKANSHNYRSHKSHTTSTSKLGKKSVPAPKYTVEEVISAYRRNDCKAYKTARELGWATEYVGLFLRKHAPHIMNSGSCRKPKYTIDQCIWAYAMTGNIKDAGEALGMGAGYVGIRLMRAGIEV